MTLRTRFRRRVARCNVTGPTCLWHGTNCPQRGAR